MARFTVRIELRNGVDGEGYESFSRAMEARGFTRDIGINGGRRYHLPTAEYRIVGKYTRAQVGRMAEAVLGATAGKAAILVTQGPCSWINLRGVPQ